MRHFLFFIILVFVFSNSYSRKFYFSSSTGNDTYTVSQAQNQATPWKSLQKLQSLITNGNTTFLPGDTIAFKRGDVFSNGHTIATGFQFVSCSWINFPSYGYTAPSGTQANPIVLTNYGDINLAKPNFIYPTAATPTISNSNNVFEFAGVSWIVLDGLQFNDYRFPQADKANAAYTRSALILGEWTQTKLASNGIDTIFGSHKDTANRKWMVKNFTVKNCYFNNVSFAFGSVAAENSNLIYNTIENLKSTNDTTGNNDIMAGAFDAINGFRINISYNYIKGAWGKSGRFSSSNGLGGVAFDMFCVKYSKFSYNTIIDCSGMFEIGNLDQYDTLSGSWYDTFAYNKVINCGQMGYIHGSPTSVFRGNNRNIACYNNVFINNNSSRISGPNFGYDLYNDGQSFRGDANRNYKWWFFKSQIKCPNNALPITDTSWSNPINPPYCNYSGHRSSVQYADDNIRGNADTLVDLRNNIFYSTVGDQIIYDKTRNKFKHRNNIYYIKGGFLNPTSLGGILGTGELSTTNRIFLDTSAALPENWDLHLFSGSPAIGAGTSVGLYKDFDGTSFTGNPDIGLYSVNSPSIVSPTLNATATQGAINCYGNTTTVTISATGGTQPYNGIGTFTVSAGTYNYIVTDATGTRDTVFVTISQPTAISPTITAGRIIVYGGTTTITVTATGGTGIYTYKLNSGSYQTSNIFSNVTKGIDTIYVKDANGCIAIGYITITQPSAPLVANATTAATTICNGATTIITVTGSGGTAPYTGTGNFTVTAGTYTYTIIDSNGVTASKSITISQYAAITANVSSGTISAYGGKTTVTVSNASNGLSPYSYSLNGSIFQTSSSFSNVGAGNHNITIKDARGCTVVKTISITQPLSTLNCTSTSTGTILCNGSTVTVTVTATGGTSPYSGTGTFTVTGGTYTYTVTDAVGAVKTTTITISQPNSIVPTISAGRIIFFGGTTSITVTATGGTGAYTYKLNRGAYQNSNVFTGVPASRDTIYVKDANGCVASGIITITQPLSALTATATMTNSVACFGGSATINVSATGGTAPYTGTGVFTVAAGTYNYTVTDSNGVTNTTNIVVSQPAVLNSSLSSGTISTYGGTTTITTTASGGTNPYSYSLNNGIYQSTNTFSNIPAGTYSVTSKDSKGCLKTNSITITQPLSTLNCTATASGPILCNGNSVTVNVVATGGTPPYTGTGSFNVPAGTYTYTVTDAVGTVRTASITLSQPTVISPTITAGRIISFGGTTTITINATGGTGAYSYKLNRGTYQTSNTFTGVPAGRDTVYVKDANSCIASSVIVITQPLSALTANISTPTNTICNGSTAVVNVTATGGTPPYTGTGSFTVSAGTYTYSVTDSNGVRSSSSITINQYSAITATVTAGTISVYGAKTTVTVSNAANGRSPYTYSINGSAYQTSNTFSNIGAGIHDVNIKDSRGCIINKSVTITQPPSTLNMTATPSGNILCNGGNVNVVVAATGGTSPYTGTGTFVATSGTQTYTVTDAVGSVKSITLVITQPTAIVPTITSGRIITFGGTTTITATALGGIGTYTYKLNNGSYQTSNSFTNVIAGTHTVYVKDANACVVSATKIISQPSALLTATSSITAAINCNGGSTTVNVTGAGGTPPYTGVGSFTVSAGTYNYLITDSNGVTANTSITVSQPTAVTANVSSGTIANYGGTTTVTVSAVTGGQSPYTYAINNGNYQSGTSFSNIPAGTHNINIKDSRGCILNKSITITQPLPLSIVIVSVTHNTCRWVWNGTITVGATGGRAPYNYRINTYGYSTNNFFNLLGPATYRLAVKDANGDSSITNVTILPSTIICTARNNNNNEIDDSLTGSKLSLNENLISVSPNPSTGNFNITIDNKIKNVNFINLYNNQGLLIKKIEKQTDYNKFIINENLAPGIYFVKIGNNKSLGVRKIIKL